MSENFKRCTKCGEDKPETLEFWYPEKKGSAKFLARCRTCIKQKVRTYHELHPKQRRRIYTSDTHFVCTRCRIQKPATTEFFSPQPLGKGNRFGLRARCKDCLAAINREKSGGRPFDKRPHVKHCPKCETDKPATTEFFHTLKRLRLGLSCWCKECKNAEVRRIATTEPNKVVARVRAWRRANPEKVKLFACALPWRKAARQKARETRKRNALPQWADLVAIAAIYRECARVTAETGIMHHVDHIVPIGGKHVCGLHVENNLRVVPADVNLSKNNRLLEELLA